ncbi:MAG TPA: YbjQ family protein [Rhizobiales bacterium]|nr:YbjQ family protein [Hyphomicrobiales bacterium]
MIVTTTNTLGDQDIVETLGMVRASTTWRRRILKTYQGGIRSVQQNGMLNFEEALEEIKQEAMAEMVKKAKETGATAVIGMQEQINEVTAGVFMVTVMGTAVRCQPKQQSVNSFATANDNLEDLFHLYERPAMAANGGSNYRH